MYVCTYAWFRSQHGSRVFVCTYACVQMWIYVCTCTHVDHPGYPCEVYMHTCLCAYRYKTHTHTYVQINPVASVQSSMYTHTHTQTHMHKSHPCCLSEVLQKPLYVCIVYIHKHIHIHTYRCDTYTYTHINKGIRLTPVASVKSSRSLVIMLKATWYKRVCIWLYSSSCNQV